MPKMSVLGFQQGEREARKDFQKRPCLKVLRSANINFEKISSLKKVLLTSTHEEDVSIVNKDSKKRAVESPVQITIDPKSVPIQIDRVPQNGTEKRAINIQYNSQLAKLFKVRLE